MLPALATLEGCSVGGYKLDRLVAAGGVSSVYVGRRSTGGIDQTVAVKLLDLPDTEIQLEVFQRECSALALLDHPNIPKLLGFGLTPYGGYFIALEYVDGLPIDVYCAAKRLSIPDRLALFIDVLHTAEYAHSSGVIHGDIKPGNVLVTSEGRVKLIDFGAARLDREPTNWENVPSAFLTPEYAAPERYRGMQTPQTDIYNLGMVLGALVAGNRSCAPCHAASTDVTANRISDSSVGPAGYLNELQVAISRRMRRELRAILRVALDPIAAQRYPCTATMRVDLENVIRSRPVQAVGGGYTYRICCWGRRNKNTIAIAALGLCMMAGGSGTILTLHRRSQQSEVHLSRLMDVIQTTTDVNAPLNRRDTALSATLGTLSALDYKSVGIEPGVRAIELYVDAGDNAGNITARNHADAPAAARYYGMASNLIDELKGRTHDTRLTVWEAMLTRRWGDLASARMEETPARRYYTSARSVFVGLVRDPSCARVSLLELVKISQQLGFLDELASNTQQALEDYGQAVVYGLRLKTLDETAGDLSVAICRLRLANVLAKCGRGALATREANLGAKLLRRRYANQPFDSGAAADMAIALLQLGDTQAAASQAGARRQYELAAAILRDLRKADSSNSEYRRNLAQAYLRLRVLDLKSGRIAGARKQTAAALEILGPLVSLPSPLGYDIELYSWIALAGPFRELYDGSKVNLLLNRYIRTSGSASPSALDLLARSYALLGQYELAIQTERQALDRLSPGADKTEYVGMLDTFVSHFERRNVSTHPRRTLHGRLAMKVRRPVVAAREE